jgi:hypothetical protein
MDTSAQGKKILVPLGEETGRLRSKTDNYLWTKFECYEVKYFEME